MKPYKNPLCVNSPKISVRQSGHRTARCQVLGRFSIDDWGKVPINKQMGEDFTSSLIDWAAARTFT